MTTYRTPTMKLTRVTTARTYLFHEEARLGCWASITVNDGTGELLVQSDHGQWMHRWGTNPDHLGAPTFTEFLRRMRDVGYLYDKLHYGKVRGVFSPEKTVIALREALMERWEPRVLWTDQAVRNAWDDLEEVMDVDSVDLFLERIPDSTYKHITEEPHCFIEEEEPHGSMVLRTAILPALLEALRAEVAEPAAAPDSDAAVAP